MQELPRLPVIHNPYISRPFVLPIGDHEIEIEGTGIAAQNNASHLWQGYDDFNLYFRHAVSHEVTWVYAPVAIGLEYQTPIFCRKTLLGFLGIFNLAHQQKLGFKPVFNSYYRHLFSATRSIELHLKYFVFIPFGNGHRAVVIRRRHEHGTTNSTQSWLWSLAST